MPNEVTHEEARVRFRATLVSHCALWAVLVGLVMLSLGLSFVQLGSFNLLIAIAIAAVQVAVLGFFFMSLREASVLICITAGAGFVFLLAMVVLTLNDLFSRI